MTRLRRYCCVALFTTLWGALLVASAGAQAVPSAYGPEHRLWAGAEFSSFSASFPYQSSQRLTGAGAFADFNLSQQLGLEGEARFLHFGGYEGSTESSYLAGPKFHFLARGRFRPYGKFFAGVGRIQYPYAIGSASYFALAPGGGTEYRLSRRWMLHLDYEYQLWLNSPGYANEPNHELTPNGAQIGVAYRLGR